MSILHARGIKAIGSTLISNVGQAGTSAATYTAHNDINQFIPASGNSIARQTSITGRATPPTATSSPRFCNRSSRPTAIRRARPTSSISGAEAEAGTLDLTFFAPEHSDPH
jgi:hypothetical protein